MVGPPAGPAWLIGRCRESAGHLAPRDRERLRALAGYSAEPPAGRTVTQHRGGLPRRSRAPHAPDGPPKYFAHAATVGLNVDFAKLATRASVRGRLGRLTYLAAAVYAVRERATFTCTLEHDGVTVELDLLQLSVISAPVIGGALGLTVRGPHPAEHRLDVLAVEDVSPPKMLRAGLFLLLGINRTVPGVRALQVARLGVESQRPLGLSLDGELDGNLPGQFEAVAGALGVIVPRRS